MNRRVLLIDDNVDIHQDYHKILASTRDHEIDALERALFGEEPDTGCDEVEFELESAYSGLEGVESARRARDSGSPYAMAFVDMRMPPGIDGLETSRRLFALDPEIQVVICTAYSDHSWEEIHEVLGNDERLFILKKPFDVVEVRQLVHALTEKWARDREATVRIRTLVDSGRGYEARLRQAREDLHKADEERQRMELELLQAQKLEALGRLASGVAHELNTPIQFVGDNAAFLRDGYKDLIEVIEAYRSLVERAARPDLDQEATRIAEEADLEYLTSEVDSSLDAIAAGLDRVAHVVAAMRAFAHSGSSEFRPVDLNAALSQTLVVARSEYKQVADVETDFSDIPLVTCRIGDLNQVFLNLVVNAAHAIQQAGRDRGKIRVRTGHSDDWVVVTISDDGCGIPVEVQDKVFDPFFTTKEVGKGTGQGLAIARSIVVERHHGRLWFETELGKGTTFHLAVPVAA